MLIFLDNFYILQEEKGEPEGDDKETKTQDEEISQDQQRERVRQNHWRNQSLSENFIKSILQRVSICYLAVSKLYLKIVRHKGGCAEEEKTPQDIEEHC